MCMFFQEENRKDGRLPGNFNTLYEVASQPGLLLVEHWMQR